MKKQKSIETCLPSTLVKTTGIPVWIALAVLLFLMQAGSLTAAMIVWTAKNITGDSDVSTNGTVLQAINLGTLTGAPATIVNGVSFFSTNQQGGLVTRTVGSGEGALTLTSGDAGGTYAYQSFGVASAPFSNLSGSYQTLLTSAFYNYNPAVSLSLTISGLETGKSYETLFWVNDSRALASAHTETFAAGNTISAKYNVQGAAGGMGQFVTGTFVADAGTQSILITSSDDIQLNGYELIGVVPEPNSVVLLGVAYGMIFLRRYRRHDEN